MKKLIIGVLVSSFALSTLTFAEGPGFGPRHHGNPEKQLARLSEKLNLDEAQQEQVNVILQNKHTERKALIEKYKPQREAFKQEMNVIRDNTHAQLAEILTPEQLEQFNEMREKRKNRKGRCRGKQP